jgi:DNA polymerase-3 subunit epsilon
VRLFARRAKPAQLAPHQAEALSAYRALTQPPEDAPLSTLRIVVADVETSGLNPHRDRLIAIGAVALVEGVVQFGDSFRIVVRQSAPSASRNILVHGIDGTTQLGGADAAEALAAWLRYAGRAPLAGFHADFDRTVLSSACLAALGIEPANVWLDLAFLAPALFHQRARTLDDWMRIFGIEAYARHDALSDALATAQLMQIVAVEAARRGMRTLAELKRLEREQRALARALR